jgi:hypothetical protein
MIANPPKQGTLKRSACGHGIINTQEEAYIHSQATGKDYCDMICACKVEGYEYRTEDREWLKSELEIVSYG